MEINNIEREEIRPLICNYIFHLVLFILIFILHLIIYTKIYWIDNIFSNLFITCTFIGILYFLFPITPIIMIFIKSFKLKIIHIFRKLSLLFLILSIIIGLLISVVIFINTLNSKLFCKECPFSWTITHLNQIFQKYYGRTPPQDDIKDDCKSRRCILDSVDLNQDHPYNYLCNYDPSYDFDDGDETFERIKPDGTKTTTQVEIFCSSVGGIHGISFAHSELNDYLDLCYYLTEFHYCQRFTKPKKMYDLDMDDSCPENSYLFLLYILCVLLIIIDIVISLLPWGVEYISLKRIIQMLQNGVRKANSHNSTARSSVVSNNEQSFKKENTIIIISPLNDNENILNININRNNKLSNIKDSTNQILINSKDEDEKDKEIKHIKPIILNQESERKGLKTNGNQEDKKINPIEIHVFNRNRSNDINISTDLNAVLNTINPRARDLIEENNKKK